MIKVENHIQKIQSVMTTGFYLVLRYCLSALLGFITGRCRFLDDLSPFSLILLSSSSSLRLSPTFCYLGSTLGLLTAPFRLTLFKYITALTMLYTVYMVFQKSTHVIKGDTSIITAASNFTAGFIFLLVDEISIFHVLVLIVESLLICCCIYFVNYAAKAFKKGCFLTSRELIAAMITVILFLATLHNTVIFQMNLSRIAAIILYFLSLSCLKISHTAVLGCFLGIVMAAIGNGGDLIFSAMTIGTLTGCVFSVLSDRLGMTAFILVYDVVLIFMGKFPWNYYWFAEPLIAFTIVFFIPKRPLRKLLSDFFILRNPAQENKRNIKSSTLIHVCKRNCEAICPKSADCYHASLAEIKSGLEQLKDEFRENNHIKSIEAAIPFCVKPSAMKNIVEECLYSETAGSFEELAEQLERISKQMEYKINSATKPIRFFEKEEKELRCALEKRRLAIQEIAIATDEKGIKTAKITFEKNEQLLYEKIIIETAESIFNHSFSCRLLRNEEYITAFLRETDQFRADCAALCKTKKEEQFCGDSALGFSIGNSKYILILSDGMGSGKEASLKSKQTINILKRLIGGGLSIPCAINAYRSVSRFDDQEYFSTLDICCIDLNSGVAAFYKAGAFDSYIIHKDEIITIKGGGIPPELCDQEKMKHTSYSVSENDILLMVTDGICVHPDIEALILNSYDPDPKIFCKKMLRTISEYENNEDDITVIACKIQKNTE